MFKKIIKITFLFFVIVTFLGMKQPSYAIKGKPNSTKVTYDKNGNKKQERQYDKDGRAQRDVDYVPNEEPHEHDWDWSGENEKAPKRGERKPVENVSKKVKKAAILGTTLYFIISEGSRIVIPIRNLVPIV